MSQVGAGRMTGTRWARLAAYLAGQGLAVDDATAPRRCQGGLANENWEIRLTTGEGLIVRRAPAGDLPPGANDRSREHRVLTRLADAYPLAPRSFVLCDDPGVIGAPFVVLEQRSGEALHHGSTRAAALAIAQARTLAAATVDAIAALHDIDPRSVGLDDLGKPAGFAMRTARRWIDRAASRALPNDVATACDVTARWLVKNEPVDGPPVILHNDVKIDNFLFDFDRARLHPTALLDWDQCTRGAAELDIAMCLVYWIEPDDPPEADLIEVVPRRSTGTVTRADLVARYAATSARALDDLTWFRTLATFKAAVIFHHQLPATAPDARSATAMRELGCALFVVAHDLAVRSHARGARRRAAAT